MTDEEREQVNRSDLEKINAAADYLNAEMEDLLSYQADPLEDEDLYEEPLKVPIRVPISDADIEK
ncbi:MAG: hypothetical protein ACRD25_02185 [Terracidiphilus sp.]